MLCEVEDVVCVLSEGSEGGHRYGSTSGSYAVGGRNDLL